MIRTARQLKDLSRNKARENNSDARIVISSYMMERFLERIALSEYKDNFILKGGMLVASMVGLKARSTMDIDTTVKGTSVSVDDVKNIIAEIIQVSLDDGMTFQIKKVDEIMDEAEYPGVRVHLDCLFDGMRIPLKIDISTGDIITPKEIRYSFKLMYEERTIDIWAYPLETVIAEKLETIISRAEANTRMRDFYDIYILSAMYNDKINPAILRESLTATSEKRGSAPLMQSAEQTLQNILDSQEMQRLWKNYQTKYKYASDISWGMVNHSVKCMVASAGLLEVKETSDKSKDKPEPPSLLKRLHSMPQQPQTVSEKRSSRKKDDLEL